MDKLTFTLNKNAVGDAAESLREMFREKMQSKFPDSEIIVNIQAVEQEGVIILHDNEVLYTVEELCLDFDVELN